MNISLAAEAIFHIGDFPITNTLLVAWAIVLLLAVLSLFLKGRIKEIPSGLQNILEAVFEAILKLIDSVTQDRKLSYKVFPIVTTIFIFVILSNWVEILPGLGSIGILEVHEGHEVIVPFIRSSSADLNFTLAIAISSVLITQIFGIATIGAVKYSRRFLNFKNPIMFFVGILELFSELAKIISFSFRLFGNIFAGEVLLLVVAFLVPYFAPLPFLFLELFVGFVQAVVFSMLTLVFIKIAVSVGEH